MTDQSYVNFDPEFPYYRPYYDYIPEFYLRFPFFLFSSVFPMFWGIFSNLFYLYVTLGFLVLYSFKKDAKITVLPFAFLILLIGYSTWTSSAFHYVRYFPFSLLSLLICHFCCTYLFTFPGRSMVKRRILILILAFVPVLFHQINLLYLLF